jgi:undecaprenyl-diphosphatase
VALAAAAVLIGVFPADVAIRDAILALASPPVIAVMRVVNAAGDWRLLVPGTVLLLVVFERARRRWWLLLGLMLLAAASADIVKAVVGRPRPEAVSFGFPSGHATAASAFFGTAISLAGSLSPRRRTLVRVVSGLIIVLVGVARVMLRAHWPSDVLGGIALGLAIAATAALIASSRATVSSSSADRARAPRGS